MSYTLADVDAAEKRIREECPGAMTQRGDYDHALSVAKADLSHAYIVFQPERPNGQREIVSNVDAVIEALRA